MQLITESIPSIKYISSNRRDNPNLYQIKIPRLEVGGRCYLRETFLLIVEKLTESGFIIRSLYQIFITMSTEKIISMNKRRRHVEDFRT